MTIRTLRAAERETWLELLDGWALPDGWRGRDFFRRFVEHDPGYDDDNVLVSEDAGRLVACVQIFPRRLGVRGRAIATGGIGTVFTREDARGSGVSSALLAAAADAMRARGMLLSLLFAERIAFYTRAGFTQWPGTRVLVRPAQGDPPPRPRGAAGTAPSGLAIRAFDAARDLAAATVLHAARPREGAVLRDAALWSASLRLAGNPEEDFLVAHAPSARAGAARAEGPLLAYARATRMHEVLLGTELVRAEGPDGVRAAVALVHALLGAREPDALATVQRPSAELRRFVVLPPLLDAALDAALAASGLALRDVPDPSAMLRVLDAPGLVRALDLAPAPGEGDIDYLRHALPPERLGFWPADRF